MINLSKGLGKIGCAVALESVSDNTDKLKELGKMIAMHVAANNPEALSIDQVSAESLQRYMKLSLLHVLAFYFISKVNLFHVTL